MRINVKTGMGEYPVYIERGGLSRLGELFSLNRKCMIVTDENIPQSLVEAAEGACGEAHRFVITPGEHSKTLASFEACLEKMLDASFTRGDCVIALGGGVVGDLAGFIASAYLRGVDFYNVPTTVLSQVDSSVGGKVAVNFRGLKNMVGAFYPPKGVLVDLDTLATLPPRHVAAGLAEAVKMGLSLDESLFRLFEEGDPHARLEAIIEKSLLAKAAVVEADEREGGIRKVLNFGHTLAHAVESESHKGDSPLYHGECVALGMIPMCTPEVRARLVPVLEKLGLPTACPFDYGTLISAMGHDKKMKGDSISVIRVEKAGEYRIDTLPFTQFAEEVKGLKL